MTDHDDHFDDFRPHTRLKHLVLQFYLEAWAFKLLRGGKHGPSVSFVDGFAGKGSDANGRPGSPVIAGRAALAVRARMDADPATAGRRLRVVCCEPKASYFRELRETLDVMSNAEPGLIQALRGSFAECFPRVAFEATGPVLAFLDPFGIAGLVAATYQPLLAVPGSEIFVLVANAGAHRNAAAFTQSSSKHERALSTAAANLPLFEELEATHLAHLAALSAEQRDANRRNAEKTLAHYQTALGDSLRARMVLEGPSDDAPARLALAMRETLQEAGARYVLEFPVSDEDGRHKHVFMHATSSAVGVREMKAAISRALKSDELPTAMRERYRRDLWFSLDALVEIVRNDLAGETLRWSGDGDDTARNLLLLHLPLFQLQMDDVKKRLRAEGLLVHRDGRKEHVVVPPRS